jgi:hypothetical protein
MRRVMALVSLLAALPLISGASDFDWLVRDFARESGVQPLHIPMFGLVRFVVAAIEPAGASELNLAVFEHAHFDPDRFRELTGRAVGPSWKPMIRVRSRNRETTEIYAQTDEQRLRLLIATLDQQDATFVEVRVKPQELMRFVDQEGWNRRQTGR